MSSARIASIHWAAVTTARSYRGKAYGIPAVPLNAEPVIIQTHDLIQRDEGPWNGSTKERQKLQYLVTGEEIARCIVGEWTGTTVVGLGKNPQRHPGIWIVRDRLPVIEQTQKMIDGENRTAEERMVLDAGGHQLFRPATPDEAQQMWKEDLDHARMADRAYAEWCWNRGNQIYHAWEHGSKEPVPREMPPEYKTGARHYGMDAEWLKEAASSNSMPCPHCERIVSKTAMICMYCTEPINLKRWAIWKAEKEKAMSDAQMEVETAPGAASVPSIPLPPGPRGISNRVHAE